MWYSTWYFRRLTSCQCSRVPYSMSSNFHPELQGRLSQYLRTSSVETSLNDSSASCRLNPVVFLNNTSSEASCPRCRSWLAGLTTNCVLTQTACTQPRNFEMNGWEQQDSGHGFTQCVGRNSQKNGVERQGYHQYRCSHVCHPCRAFLYVFIGTFPWCLARIFRRLSGCFPLHAFQGRLRVLCTRARPSKSENLYPGKKLFCREPVLHRATCRLGRLSSM
jgi:hypothetical protein